MKTLPRRENDEVIGSLCLLRMGVLLFLLSVLFACGRKGPPKPPEDSAPAPVRFLTAKGQVEGVLLVWETPLVDAGGHELGDLKGFEVMRSEYEDGEPPDFDVVEEIEIETKADSPIVLEDLKPFSYLDREVVPGRVYDYMVRPVNLRGVEGVAREVMRVKFIGESSLVERLGGLTP